MNIVNTERERIIEEAKELKNKNKLETINRTKDEEFVATSSDDSYELLDYHEHQSSACCNLDEIEGFIFGGLNSRFWMLRKHINMIPLD